ncbi:hypothetical protein L208DRAFT_1384782 [Tricholoma matsutake]|nr:hypothetical protein L208DRAFT_1384782 [Tricholoma matsutake 945]
MEGVFKESFPSLCKKVFDTDRGLSLANVKNELYPTPHAYTTEVPTRHNSNWDRFIGRILGKAMYKGILVDVAFAGFFLAKLLWTIYSNIKPCISLGDYVLASTCTGIFHSLGYSYYTRSGI